MAKARGFPALTFPSREDSKSRASYKAAFLAALAKPLLIWLISERLTACPGGRLETVAPEGVSSTDGPTVPANAGSVEYVSIFQHSGDAAPPLA